MGWGEPAPTPAELEKLRVAYDRLWHRVCAHQDGHVLTRHLPTPHQLRTGERRQDVLARIAATGTLEVEPTGRKVHHPPTCGGCRGRGCPEVRLVSEAAS